MHAPSFRWAASLPGGTVAVLAWLLLAPAEAWAACGDHVVTARSLTGSPSQPDSAIPSDPLSTHDHRRPCSGPTCSRAPVAPPAAPASVAQERSHEAALPLGPMSVSVTHPTGAQPDDPLARPIRRGVAIFHPPRA